MYMSATGFPRCSKCNCQFYPRMPSDCAPVPGSRVETNDLCNECRHTLSPQTNLAHWHIPYGVRGPQC